MGKAYPLSSPLAALQKSYVQAQSVDRRGLLAEVQTGIVSTVDKRERESRLHSLVTEHIDFVARVLRNLGTPHIDIDDSVQRTFITASNHFEDIREGHEKGFLFQIALRVAAHARRSLARRREVPAEEEDEPIDMVATPEHLTDQKRMREMLDAILDTMPIELRSVFVLHEFEGLTMAEIAELVEIAPGTVASRLRRARAEFRLRVRRTFRPMRAKVGS
jgi:RNA polymerase sigma-70 factor (ECF subfamily)